MKNPMEMMKLDIHSESSLAYLCPENEATIPTVPRTAAVPGSCDELCPRLDVNLTSANKKFLSDFQGRFLK